MTEEKQLAKALMDRNLSLSQWMDGVMVAEKLKELSIPAKEMPNFLEANNELLRDPDFRVAAYDLLELRKRTGKGSNEAQAYIKELDLEIATKEKQNSDWIRSVEKAKSEFKNWEQKRNDEERKFESERVQNRSTLEEDKRKLEQQLKEHSAIRVNIEKTISHEAKLQTIGLDLETFDSIVEGAVEEVGIDVSTGKKIKEALKNFGSLHKAIVEREKEGNSKRRIVSELSKEERKQRETLSALKNQIIENRQIITEQEELIELQTEETERNKWQYEFFQCFISMLLGSPSAEDPLDLLGLKLRELAKRGWTHSAKTSPEERRSLFVLNVMGSYLHSIYCERCGASFIVNKACSSYSKYRDSYYCPVCDSSWYSKQDNSFLNLMVSPELSTRFQATREALEKMKKMDPEIFRRKIALLDLIPDEVIKALPEG